VRLRTALPSAKMLAAEEEVKGAKPWPAGTVFVTLDGGNREEVEGAVGALSLKVTPLPALPEAKTHELALPRVAILHTWLSTQDEGWFRLAFEDLRIPYAYVSTQAVAADADLRARFDVIVFPPAGGTPQQVVGGLPPGPPLPWKKTALTPNLGVDSTDDMRPGLGFAGVANLARFVEQGGVLVTVEESAQWAAQFGLARWVRAVETSKVKARGSLLRAQVADRTSPVAWGYDESVPVYFDGSFVLEVGSGARQEREGSRPSGRGGPTDPDVPQGRPYVAVPPKPTPGPGEEGFQMPEDYRVFFESRVPRPEDRPRVVLAFPKAADQILLSGMMEGGDELAGKGVVVDAPLGKGHVLLLACNPMWRVNTQGSYALVTNAILNWNALSLGWPPKK